MRGSLLKTFVLSINTDSRYRFVKILVKLLFLSDLPYFNLKKRKT